jgi:hypothetical protein
MEKDGWIVTKNKARATWTARISGFHPRVAPAVRKVMKEMAECGFTD